MRTDYARTADIPVWLALASEVEPLFGPLTGDPAFLDSLRRHIAHGTAYCIREDDGPPGTPLMGGMLVSASPHHHYEIEWLAVARRWQRQGIGRRLMRCVLALVQTPADITVTTFANGIEVGNPARQLYEQFGFRIAGPGPTNPAGIPTHILRRTVSRRPPTVRAVIQHEDRYLLVQHDNVLPLTFGKWGLPGGRVDSSDPDHETALRRELREELGVEVDIVRFIATYEYRDRRHHIFHVRPRSTALVIDSHEILGHAWMTLDEVSQWHTQAKLHTGFELTAITASRQKP